MLLFGLVYCHHIPGSIWRHRNRESLVPLRRERSDALVAGSKVALRSLQAQLDVQSHPLEGDWDCDDDDIRSHPVDVEIDELDEGFDGTQQAALKHAEGPRRCVWLATHVLCSHP